MESMLSLLIFLTFASPLITLVYESGYVDDSLYRIQLSEDVWRVIYLRNGFHDLDRSVLEVEFMAIEEETDLCIFMDGIRITNCRGGCCTHQMTASLTKTVVEDSKPKTYRFSIGK